MLKAYWRDFVRFIPLLIELTARDFKLKYRRSFLGIVWSMLNPLLIMIVITSMFSILLKSPPSDMPFAVYYITGSTLFSFLSEATSSSMTSVIMNASLIKKVYIPKYIFALEKCAFSFINMLLSSIAMLMVVGFYVIQGDICPHITMFLIFIPMFFTFIFTVGVGLILSALAVFFRDIMHIWNVITTIWMYATPIMYPAELLKNHGLEWVIRLNPMFYFVDDFRNLMINGIIPDMSHFFLSFVICFSVLSGGLLLFKKVQDRFILHI